EAATCQILALAARTLHAGLPATSLNAEVALLIKIMTTQCVDSSWRAAPLHAAHNRTTLTRLVLLDPLNSKPRPRPSGAFSLGGDRRVGACANGDELPVGNWEA